MLCSCKFIPAVRFDERNKLSVKQLPKKTSESLRSVTILSMIFAALIDYTLNFQLNFMVSSQAEISTYWHVCHRRAWRETQFCMYLSLLTSMSMTRVEWVPARVLTFTMPCQSLAVPGSMMIWKWLPSYCASQAHVWIILWNTKSIFLLSLLVLVNQTDESSHSCLRHSRPT